MAKPKPSEWGKLSRGQTYQPVSLDLARAIFSIGLGEHVGSLFWFIAENSWAPMRRRGPEKYPDPVGCRLNLSELARIWEVPHQRLCGAKKWLLDARIVREEDGEFWINKDVHTWVNPSTGASLLRPGKLAYAQGARRRADPTNHEVVMNGVPCKPTEDTNTNMNGVPCKPSTNKSVDMNGVPFTPCTVHRSSPARCTVHPLHGVPFTPPSAPPDPPLLSARASEKGERKLEKGEGKTETTPTREFSSHARTRARDNRNADAWAGMAEYTGRR